MQIPKETQEKLRRYIINSDPFLFGALKAKNKKGRMMELQSMGLLKGYSLGSNPNYSRFYQDLLVELGVKGILERIIIPRVQEMFQPEVLEFLRRCWEQGQLPSLDYLKQQKLYRKHPFTSDEVYEGIGNPRIAGYREPAFIFFQINTQSDFIEAWTTFAAVWFEEIEPLLGADSGTAIKS
jgi:hypothetical protein